MPGRSFKSLLAWSGLSVPFDPAHTLVSSPFFSPRVLGVIRLVIALYTLATAVTVLAYNAVHFKPNAGGYFSYFTNLTYIGIVSYFWAAAVQTIAFSRNNNESYPLQRWPRVLQFLHILLYSTITTYPIIVTVVFWSVLLPPTTFSSTFSGWSNVAQHAMNSGFALFEILLTSAGPSPWLHLIPLLFILACYLALAYITYATEGFYTYAFLDPSTEHGLLAAYIVGIALGECVIFVIVQGACRLRNRLGVLCHASTNPSEPEALDEREKIGQSKELSSSDV
ncbi:hypothetical protein SERLA73DRAFT_181325 [Serpula lacrymans var. lacrymans S7.3]|uniref:FAR-17a/AIG1-like protein n=2 Tax=Serpula lacrymans var. lacrymans TaxID=341189 RepID=F8PXV3_SERL3|nr:uncharacterized protein SERLADRAFT_389326 [Serpula lacrymans var. lacrymans S7.9]EGN98716.1 hypothetical protein SERLA73DRAFT_181325 [Serpula lacrymans var. lacrymans S7.3]EGO24318.1 hypothetical protein SERLADRAFT_389326 [Serpula lacrymans var. lacrymans S7.9]